MNISFLLLDVTELFLSSSKPDFVGSLLEICFLGSFILISKDCFVLSTDIRNNHQSIDIQPMWKFILLKIKELQLKVE